MAEDRRIATVSQINSYLKNLLEACPVLQNVWVRGEISNFKNHYSGHMYLTLKDENSVLKAVMFKGANSRLTFMPENGMKVLSRGRVAVFPRDGQYQLYIEEMEPDGIGNLYMEFERLKEKLREEGLFDEERKKPIPAFPKKIGVVTSGTGVGVRDILNILKRRYPLAEVSIFPVLVQGPDASADIVRAIECFNRNMSADVLIVGRGGGSIEDLWAFNEEATARAIADSNIPVISAVGHETDFTISDFVADLRAPTPSAAAELAVPDGKELLLTVQKMQRQMAHALKVKTENNRKQLTQIRNRAVFIHPMRLLEGFAQEKDAAYMQFINVVKERTSEKKESLSRVSAKLDALSPLSVLSRGYAIARKENGEAVRKTADVRSGEELSVRVSDGEIPVVCK